MAGNFFISTTGSEVVKIFDNINALLKSKNIRYPSRVDGVQGNLVRLSGKLIRKQLETAAAEHDAATSAGCADALQHSERVAATHYRVCTAEAAKRSHSAVKRVEYSKLAAEFIERK